jgi:hypothetical protein
MEMSRLAIRYNSRTPTRALFCSKRIFSRRKKRWQDSIGERAKSLGIKIHGAYVSTIEHTFYFLLDADDVKVISEFFSQPFLTHHKARISPVIEIQKHSIFHS